MLKLNATKEFLTGIYPYHIMSSTFYPVSADRHALKTSMSMQEWCGHVYAQVNNRDRFEFRSHSYFEGEADQDILLDKTVLEDELWTQIRVAPETLPTGTVEVLPSLAYLRMRHVEPKAYSAELSLTDKGSTQVYTIRYPDLSRSLAITFERAFPYSILGWEETSVSGFGADAETLVGRAERMGQLKTPYWRQNAPEDEALRAELGL